MAQSTMPITKASLGCSFHHQQHWDQAHINFIASNQLAVSSARCSSNTSAQVGGVVEQTELENLAPRSTTAKIHQTLAYSSPALSNTSKRISVTSKVTSKTHQTPAHLNSDNSSTSSGISVASSRSRSSQPEPPADLRVIDHNTPPPIARMILDAIAITPYDVEEDYRTPELFIDQFETYAGILDLTREQKRVLFAGLAYQDDASCFEALKYDTIYEDMANNFSDWAWHMNHRASQIAEKQRRKKKPGKMRRIFNFFLKLRK